MAKQATKDYKAANRNFNKRMAVNPELIALDGGVYYRVLSSAENTDSQSRKPAVNSLVTVNYRGRLINDYEFDSTYNSYPETFRVREVIEGWQIALQEMTVGDKWEIFIPKDLGYGDKKNGDIPGGSTLIFEVELLAIN